MEKLRQLRIVWGEFAQVACMKNIYVRCLAPEGNQIGPRNEDRSVDAQVQVVLVEG